MTEVYDILYTYCHHIQYIKISTNLTSRNQSHIRQNMQFDESRAWVAIMEAELDSNFFQNEICQ